MTDTVKVLIEIPAGSNVKYELDEETGEMVVDRLAMRIPVNYGLIDEKFQAKMVMHLMHWYLFLPMLFQASLSSVKYLVFWRWKMKKESTIRSSVSLQRRKSTLFAELGNRSLDIPAAKMKEIKHFFEHYKDLEEGKWVKLKDWKDASVAQTIIEADQAL